MPKIVQNDAGLCCNARHQAICVLTMSAPLSQNLEVGLFRAGSRDFLWCESSKGKTPPLSGTHCSMNAGLAAISTNWTLPGRHANIKTDHRCNFRGGLGRATGAAGIDLNTFAPHVMRHTAVT